MNRRTCFYFGMEGRLLIYFLRHVYEKFRQKFIRFKLQKS